jgi:hypothetical protein
MIANVVSGLALPRFQSAGMDNFWVLGGRDRSQFATFGHSSILRGSATSACRIPHLQTMSKQPFLHGAARRGRIFEGGRVVSVTGQRH